MVQVKITGETGKKTGWHTMDYLFRNDFEAGDTETYTVKHGGSGIGVPTILHFRGWLFRIVCK